MLLIITPNPALDRTMVFPGLRLGAVQRTDDVVVAAGGKGLNVARAARTLAQTALVCAPLGGLTGDMVARLADAEGIAGRWSRQGAETRTCVLLVDSEGGDATALNESGPVFTANDWESFRAMTLSAACESQLCLLSGSLPRGVTPVALGELLGQLGSVGRRVIVDTSGAALTAALAARPYGVKVNGAELGAALGRGEVTDIADASASLAELRARGVELAAVSLGARGAMAADATGTWWACPPPINLLSSVGCGDSLLAGMSAGLLRGLALPDALRLGVACGSADALTIGGGRLDLAEVERLMGLTQVERAG